MPTIQPYQPGNLASPLVGVAGKNPQGEALREKAQNIEATERKVEELRGVQVEGVSRLRGAQLSGLSEILGAGMKGAAALVGSGMTYERRMANAQKVQNAAAQAQAHTLAGHDAAGQLSDATTEWQQAFTTGQNDPANQTDPQRFYNQLSQQIHTGRVTNADGSVTQKGIHSVASLMGNLDDKEDTLYDRKNNPTGDPFALITSADMKPKIRKEAERVLMQAADWTQHQRTANAEGKFQTDVDNSAALIAGTEGGLDATVQKAAIQINTYKDNLQTQVASGALTENGAAKMLKGAINKMNYASIVGAAVNHSDDPAVAWHQHQRALDALTNETYEPSSAPGTRMPLPMELNPQQKEQGVKMLQAAISKDEKNMSAHARTASLIGTGGVIQRTEDAYNQYNNPTVQQAVINDAQTHTNILMGLIAKEQASNHPDDVKNNIIEGYNKQAAEWQHAAHEANANNQFSETERNVQRRADQAAELAKLGVDRETALGELSDKRTQFEIAANTNPGHNAEEVRKAATDYAETAQKLYKAGIIKYSDTSLTPVANAAAAATSHQMKTHTFMGYPVHAPTLVKLKEDKRVQSAADMKAAVYGAAAAINGQQQASIQNAQFQYSHNFNVMQKNYFDSVATPLRAFAQKNNWAPAYLQKQLNVLANRTLQKVPSTHSPITQIVNQSYAEKRAAAHTKGHPSNRLVPPPPPTIPTQMPEDPAISELKNKNAELEAKLNAVLDQLKTKAPAE